MIKLLEIKLLGDSKFEILVSQNGIKKKFVIVQHQTFIDSMKEPLFYLNCGDKDFSDVWSQSYDFRQEVSQKIKQLKQAEIHELQPA